MKLNKNVLEAFDWLGHRIHEHESSFTKAESFALNTKQANRLSASKEKKCCISWLYSKHFKGYWQSLPNQLVLGPDLLHFLIQFYYFFLDFFHLGLAVSGLIPVVVVLCRCMSTSISRRDSTIFSYLYSIFRVFKNVFEWNHCGLLSTTLAKE